MNFGKLSAAAVERKLHCFLKKKEEKTAVEECMKKWMAGDSY